jgi:uncharacterized membrane protein
MFERSKTKALKANAASRMDLAVALARDPKFRNQLLAALKHGTAARRPDMSEVRKMRKDLERAWARVEKKRSHKLRTTVLVLGGGAVAAVVVVKFRGLLANGKTHGFELRTVDESIEVEVPVSTAYNQWTQFEDFPLFMEGVDEVKQVDDSRLHWAATVAGRRAEWDAKILEQHPDRQISWISEDGKKTRGTVSFEPLDERKALVRLSMSYKADGPAEALGSAAGLDTRRIRGDLHRFKELVEGRGEESGAWRGEISAGKTEA